MKRVLLVFLLFVAGCRFNRHRFTTAQDTRAVLIAVGATYELGIGDEKEKCLGRGNDKLDVDFSCLPDFATLKVRSASVDRPDLFSVGAPREQGNGSVVPVEALGPGVGRLQVKGSVGLKSEQADLPIEAVFPDSIGFEKWCGDSTTWFVLSGSEVPVDLTMTRGGARVVGTGFPLVVNGPGKFTGRAFIAAEPGRTTLTHPSVPSFGITIESVEPARTHLKMQLFDGGCTAKSIYSELFVGDSWVCREPKQRAYRIVRGDCRLAYTPPTVSLGAVQALEAPSAGTCRVEVSVPGTAVREEIDVVFGC